MRFRILLGCTLACSVFAQDTLHLTLAEAEKLAIQNNPQFGAAKLNAAASYQVPLELRANAQPTLFGSITGVGADSGSRLAAGGLNNPVVYNRLGSGLSVTQLITDFGRNNNLVESAKLRAQAQDQVTETTRAQILLATSRAYYAVLRAESVFKVAEQTVDARQLVVDQVTALAQSSLKSQLDVSFASVNLADAKLLLAGARNDIQAAQTQLLTAMGIPGQKSVTLSEEPMPDFLPDQVAPLVQDALQKRPEMANIHLEQSAAERFAQAERALQYPTIGLFGTAGFVPAGQEVLPGRYGAVGVNVNVPVFNGGLFKARRTEADYRAKAVAQNGNDLANRIARDVKVAYLNASTAFERVGLTAQLLEQAKLALDLAQSRYDLGLSSIIELSQAQLNLTSAQIVAASSKYDYQSQRAVLAFETGELR
ncbi:MAG: TolC family protein [Bryobacteraceae bacterium]